MAQAPCTDGQAVKVFVRSDVIKIVTQRLIFA